MNHFIKKFFFLPITIALLCGCKETQSGAQTAHEKANSIYHWKTVFEPDSAELTFIEKHDIRRIYMRMFDVATESNHLTGTIDVVPIATTKFKSSIPSNIEIVPVTYITIDALRCISGNEQQYATLIVERLLAMANYNECGDIKEIQLDCDWTETTKESYHKLCHCVKELLTDKNIELSITVRLHQLKESAPPADRGVLMLYNTGRLKSPETHNSILNIDDVEPYISQMSYPIPLDYAYPIFRWAVKFKDNKFVSIVSYDNTDVTDCDFMRHEHPSTYEICSVKNLVEENLGKPGRGNILYHLDYSQFKNYTDDEISEIYSY